MPVTDEAEHAAWAEAETLLGMLASFDVQVRAHPETYGLMWKPKFSEMPAEWQDDIREHGIALVRLLWPKPGIFNRKRPGWFNGPMRACVGCGAGTALYDPLGQPRHDNCGFINQAPQLRYIGGHQGKALRVRQQGS